MPSLAIAVRRRAAGGAITTFVGAVDADHERV